MSRPSDFNPLLSSANTLLILMANVKQLTKLEPEVVALLQQKTIEEMDRFVKSATTQNYSERMIVTARYCLCTALDEFVLASDWGVHSTWRNQTLLSILHKETSGGERFFVILEEISKLPRENLYLLELIYIILSLGFEGKYYCEDKSVLQQIRHRLFNLLSIHHPEQQKLLSSPHMQTLKAGKNVDSASWSQLKIMGVGFLSLTGLLIIFNFITFLSIRSPLNELQGLSAEAQKIALPTAAAPPMVSHSPVTPARPAPIHLTHLKKHHKGHR